MLILQSTYSRWDQHLLWTSSAVLVQTVQTLYSPHFWGSNHRYLKAWASNKLRNAYGGGLKATELAFRILFVLSLPSQAWQTYTVYKRATDVQSPTTLQVIQHVTCVAGKCHRPGVSGSKKISRVCLWGRRKVWERSSVLWSTHVYTQSLDQKRPMHLEIGLEVNNFSNFFASWLATISVWAVLG